MRPILPKAFDKENFAFYGTTLTGTPEQEARWKRGGRTSPSARSPTTSASSTSPSYFPPETKAAADELVHNIIAAMDRRIDKLEWMAPETKAKAQAKLAAFTPKIGYPSQWRDMSGLGDRPRRPARQRDARRTSSSYAYNIDKLGQPITAGSGA